MIEVFRRPPPITEAIMRQFMGDPDPVVLTRSFYAGLIRAIRRDFYEYEPRVRARIRPIVREQIRDVQMLVPRYWRE